jgi:hypothetical protein
MKHIKKFENYSLRSEYPNMFEPIKPEDEPQSVPGFEIGTIDPEDDEVYTDPYGNIKFNEKSEKDRYEDFKRVTRERNFYETPEEIVINKKKLYHDFIMSIYNPIKHFKEFFNNEILGKYIYGVTDFMNDIEIEGVVEKLSYIFTGNSVLISAKIQNCNKKIDETMLKETVTIDKLKSSSNKYNL